MSGVVFYRGPSLLTGDPVVGIANGLDGDSLNAKTGPMVQTYVLVDGDEFPMDAVRSGADVAICGDCQLRGQAGRDRRCYVTPFFGPSKIWKSYRRGDYPTVTWSDLRAVLEGRAVRLCAYGDPAALPFEVWREVLAAAATWTGYTHAWKRADPRFKTILMASVDSEREFFAAGLRGWRTFRVRRPGEPIIAGAEFSCPASDEMGHRTTCQRCALCRGGSSPARSVVIDAHGKPSALKAYGIDIRGMLPTRGVRGPLRKASHNNPIVIGLKQVPA